MKLSVILVPSPKQVDYEQSLFSSEIREKKTQNKWESERDGNGERWREPVVVRMLEDKQKERRFYTTVWMLATTVTE